MGEESFVNLLRDTMDHKKVSRRELAVGTQLGEIVYKYVKGTRKVPNIYVVDKLADYMQCSPVDKERLRQAWRLETYGQQRLERWKQLDRFFAHYSLDLAGDEGYSFHINIQKDTKPYLFLHNELEVQQAILALLDDCSGHADENGKSRSAGSAGKDSTSSENVAYSSNGLIRVQDGNPAGGVYVVMQANEDSMLQLLRFAEQRTKNLPIYHIFSLPAINDDGQESADEGKKDYSLISLQYLQAVIPLTLESSHYESRYYYSEISDAQTWPLGGSFLLSDRYAVIFGNSREGKNGIFSSDPELLRYLRKTFRRIHQESRPFLKHVSSYEALLETYYSPQLKEMSGEWYSYCEQPCLCPYLTPAMVEKYIHKQAAPASLLEGFVENITWYRENQLSKVVEFSRLSGIRRFLQTGRMDEIPVELYDPLSIEDRLAVLDSWLKTQETNPTHFLRWNDEENSRLSAHFFPGKGLNISFYADNLFCTFYTEERNLVVSFEDYFTHIEEDQVLTEEEVREEIGRIRKIKL